MIPSRDSNSVLMITKQVLLLLSFQGILPIKWQWGRNGIRTHGAFTLSGFQNQCLKPYSAILPVRKTLHSKQIPFRTLWLAIRDTSLVLYLPSTMTDTRMGVSRGQALRLQTLINHGVRYARIERATHGLRVRCSTDWANSVFVTPTRFELVWLGRKPRILTTRW